MSDFLTNLAERSFDSGYGLTDNSGGGLATSIRPRPVFRSGRWDRLLRWR
jgi:hypothetical protein